MYKMAVFSDIHGNLEALDAILNDISKKKIDEVICLGDVVGIGPNSKECFDRITDSKIRWILGNHDIYLINQDRFNEFKVESEKVPQYRWTWTHFNNNDYNKIKNNDIEYVINRCGKRIKFCHYFIDEINSLYPFYSIGDIKKMKIIDLLNVMDCDYIFYGHDHKHQEYKFNDKNLIDVGSSGCVTDDITYYTEIDIDLDIKYKLVPIKYDRKKFISKINEINKMNENVPLKYFINNNN